MVSLQSPALYKKNMYFILNFVRAEFTFSLLFLKVKTLVNHGDTPQEAQGEGSEYLNEVLMSRCVEVLCKILNLLKAKSSETQFVKSKEHLQDALDFIAELKSKNDQVANHIQEYDIVEI